MKLLILESNGERRLKIADTLVSAGYEVLLTTSVEEAVVICGSMQPAVVMIGWDGQENTLQLVSQQLKRTLALNSYLVLMSENLKAEQIQLGLAYGFDDFVLQPTNESELIIRAGIAERILRLKSVTQDSVTQVTAPKFSKRRRNPLKQEV